MDRRSLLVCVSLAGCGWLKSGGGGDCEDGLTTWTDAVTASDGIAAVDVEVCGEGAILLTAEGSRYLDIELVEDPYGDTVLDTLDWYNEDTWLTSAVYPFARDVVFNWPIRDVDPDLEDGIYTIYVGAYTATGYPQDDDLDLTVQVKLDDDMTEGTISARIVYAEGVDDDEDVVEAVEAAVDRWKEIWAAYGLSLVESYESSDLDPDLEFPEEGNEAIEEASSGADGTEVTVIVGESIDGSLDYYGVAGNIPGTLISTSRSGIVVSWLANSGGDGRFDDEDLRLFGETLAHEVGHYLGLFHPVEIGADEWDALEDTPQCTSDSGCEDKLGENLMFPYPVCSWTECIPQDELTDGQTGVTQRYTGTL